jgi:hypothetical protein
VIYFPFASLVGAASLPSFFGFSSSLPFYSLAIDLELGSFLSKAFGSLGTSLTSFPSFFSGALLSFLLSFSLPLTSLGTSFLSPGFLSSFFSSFLSAALGSVFPSGFASFVSFSIDPFPSFFGYSFAFFVFLSAAA